MTVPRHATQGALGTMRELEERVTKQAGLLVQRAVNDLADLTNTLAYLTEQAEIGNQGARDVLKKYFEMSRRASLAAAGVILPAGTVPKEKENYDEWPN